MPTLLERTPSIMNFDSNMAGEAPQNIRKHSGNYGTPLLTCSQLLNLLHTPQINFPYFILKIYKCLFLHVSHGWM